MTILARPAEDEKLPEELPLALVTAEAWPVSNTFGIFCWNLLESAGCPRWLISEKLWDSSPSWEVLNASFGASIRMNQRDFS
jgi:hypothetical protein